jgi:hypothetical protein
MEQLYKFLWKIFSRKERSEFLHATEDGGFPSLKDA